MLTIKRQIDSEKERYGSFTETESYANTAAEREVNDDLLLMRTYTGTATEVPERNRESANAAPAVQEFTESVTRPAPIEEERRVEAPIKRNSNAKMHDIVRSNEPVNEIRREEKPITREKKLTASAKRAIVLYMSIVLAVVIAVIVTGVCISGVNSDIAALETTIQEQEELILRQNTELGALQDANAIENKAEGLGMVKVTDGEIVDYDRLEVGENTEDNSGVFDSVRDWLNTVFGG